MERDHKRAEISLENLEKLIKETEDPDNLLHKFIDTAIYTSFKYNYNILKPSNQPPQRNPSQ